MQTVILAAGEGTRMRPLTAHRPKPMLPVGDRPLVAHTADAAVAAGASRLVFVVGYEAADVRDHFGDEYAGVPVDYATQTEQRGTADAVRAARGRLDDAPFVVLNGDDLYDPASLESLYRSAPAVGAFRVDDPRPYGVFDVDGDVVTGVTEKPDDPPSSLVNIGAYAFPAAAQQWLDVEESSRGERELTDVLARVVDNCDVRAITFEFWTGVGRPWELLGANEWVLSSLERRVDGDVHADADLRGPVVVEAGASVDAGVVVEGPALIRRDASVGPNAYVRGATVVGEGATVGHAVEVKNSVLMAGATVGHLSYVGDSVVGRDVNFGAGTTVANLRHDDETVRVQVNEESTDTGRRKFGVVVGDGAKTGIETALNAGVKLGAGARTEPGETVTRDKPTVTSTE
ncbi:bifunctional sugar-1-phosphate nucleotidylyltransferase/acetyltransferase [Halobaculum sp. D14]|uniref:bifunctional sugar-1-phosphate nucleotidylyltransferase/acetyltransferase n=1 Tax=Halobaculum sp. D14 TaxID=3421642 RepID=UPI003EBAF3CC